MESQQRIEQIVVIALLVVLAVGCLTVLRPFLSALLWALILSFSTWPLYAWLVRRLHGRRSLAAFFMTLLVPFASLISGGFIWFSPDRQAIHDRFARTVVVRMPVPQK